MRAGFGIDENGDLVQSLGAIPNGILPVHAYIPMVYDGVRSYPLEYVAYRNQMRAKRVCDKYRKRDRRSNARLNKLRQTPLRPSRKYIVMAVTVK